MEVLRSSTLILYYLFDTFDCRIESFFLQYHFVIVDVKKSPLFVK